MKKLILIFTLIGSSLLACSQSNLVWEINSDTYINDGGDTITQELLLYIPIIDRTFTDAKFLLRQKRNNVVQISKIFKQHNALDSLFTNQFGTKTHLQWIQMFLTVDITNMKRYGQEIWKLQVDPNENLIRWE
jgi:hypothetical protein